MGETKGLKTGFTFNDKLFKEPSKTIGDLHKKGIRVGLCVDPLNGIYPHEKYYPQAKDALQLKANTIISFDPLNPKLLDLGEHALNNPIKMAEI